MMIQPIYPNLHNSSQTNLLSLSLSYTHTLTQPLSHTHLDTYTHTLSLNNDLNVIPAAHQVQCVRRVTAQIDTSISLSLTHTHTLSLTQVHTLYLSLYSLSLTLVCDNNKKETCVELLIPPIESLRRFQWTSKALFTIATSALTGYQLCEGGGGGVVVGEKRTKHFLERKKSSRKKSSVIAMTRIWKELQLFYKKNWIYFFSIFQKKTLQQK